jgi:hypothetical protein
VFKIIVDQTSPQIIINFHQPQTLHSVQDNRKTFLKSSEIPARHYSFENLCIIAPHSVMNDRIAGGISPPFSEDENMVNRKIIILVAILLTFAGTVHAAQLIPDPDVQGKIQEASQPITLEGRIIYRQVGGYTLQAERAGDKIILNQNYPVLKKLAKQRRKVKVEGRINPLDISARYLFIDVIDGKSYHGDKAPMVKPVTKLTPFF